jgi:phosphoribosylformimino-5-aminoimidazole carboxamide ribotide isomerase
MTEFVIYPAIDLRGGKVVRLLQGDANAQTIYSQDVVKTARHWLAQGAQWLHIVNLDGAFGEDARLNRQAIEAILAESDNVNIQLGGGLRSLAHIEDALALGVTRVVLGTAVIENPAFGERALSAYGGEKVAFGFDAQDGRLRTRGWQEAGAVGMLPLAQRLATAGARTIIYTNIAHDGMQSGVDWQMAQQLSQDSGLDVIASGGVASLADIQAVKAADLAGVIVGKALYEGNFSLKEAIDVC